MTFHVSAHVISQCDLILSARTLASIRLVLKHKKPSTKNRDQPFSQVVMVFCKFCVRCPAARIVDSAERLRNHLYVGGGEKHKVSELVFSGWD